MLGDRARLVFQFDLLHVARLGKVKTDRLAQGLAQLLHIRTSSETARQLEYFRPQLFARLLVDAHGVHLFGHHSPPSLSPACRKITPRRGRGTRFAARPVWRVAGGRDWLVPVVSRARVRCSGRRIMAGLSRVVTIAVV